MTDAASEKSSDEPAVVLFNINDDYFFDLALRLAQQGVRIHTIVTRKPERFAERFPHTEIIDTRQFEDPERILRLGDGDAGCLSEAELERFVHVESLYLNVTDRLSYYPTTVRFRVQLFRALLRYWMRFFAERRQVGSAFYISAPHMGPDLVAFHVAKSIGVQNLFLERSLIANRVMLLEDYSEIDRVPATFLANDAIDAIKRRIQPDLLQSVHEASPWSRYSAAINDGIVTQRRTQTLALGKVLSRQLPAKVAVVVDKLRRPVEESSFFLNGASVRGYRAELARLAYRRRVERLRARYRALATSSQPGVPYVLFALHLQPERSTCPQGGVYDDQLLAIETAAKALPAGHELYVKEHPRQFSPTFLKSKHYRDDTFYRRVTSLPAVRLLPIETDTRGLIAGAVATATTTGSAGWQSLLAGKPCLAFGSPWYGGCRSCHIIRSLDDCRTAYSACLGSSEEQVERDVLVFLAYVQERLIYSSNSALFARGAPDYDTLVENLAVGLARRLRPRAAAALAAAV